MEVQKELAFSKERLVSTGKDHQKNRITEILISNAPMNYIHVMKRVLSALMLNMRTLSTGARHQRVLGMRPTDHDIWGRFVHPAPLMIVQSRTGH